MSIFGNIMSAIFGKSAAPPQTTQPSGPQNTTTPTPTPAASASASPATSSAATGTSTAASPVDVAAVLNGLAAQNKQKLNWRTSIVDLMKLLDLDSSLAARKQLAQELRYGGDMNDSAAMNIWLHKQVMTKLAENGGKVPEELKH